MNNHHEKLLSVIIVTYKQMDYLFQTIDSVLVQNYYPIELIVADDGTPNLDVARIDQYIMDNNHGNISNHIVLYDGINRGTVRNINNALSHVHGEYVRLIGGDDTFSGTETFKHEIEFLNLNESLLGVVSKCQQCDAFMNPISDIRVEKSNEAIREVLQMDYSEARKYIMKNQIFPIAVQATMFRWLFYEINGFCDENYYLIDDSPTVLRILQQGNKFGYLDIYSVNHRSAVGISTSRELFAPRRLKYYEDSVTYARKEIKPNPQIYGKVYSICIPKVSEYVYKMALSKSTNKGLLMEVLLTIRYSPYLVYYLFRNSRKVINRVKISISGTK